MFRAQQNAFDDAVSKATDENLTTEPWDAILDVCDRANSEDSGPKNVVAAMIKRLAHRNANVQLYTLELANSLCQNCGLSVHREIASRSFTDALLRLAADRNTHQQVKSKILERMETWTEMFSNNPDLGIMDSAYRQLKTQNPNLHPPSKPTKRQITEADRKEEEEELQMALELSLKQTAPPASTSTSQAQDSAPQPQQLQQASTQPAQPGSHGQTAATVSRVRALFDFQPSEPGELQFKKGDIIAVLESVYKDWWKGSLRGQTGIFPLNYVEKLSDPTPEELQREAEMEAEVFGQIKNVEKLLTLLSSSDMNARDNDEITQLYHSTLAIRPKLIELIGKYSQRKDDFTQLNEKFIKARRDYEALLEASMSQPQQPAYGRPAYAPYGATNHPPGTMPPQQDVNRFYSPRPQDNRTPQPQGIPQAGQYYQANPSKANLMQPQPPQQQQPPYPQDPRQRTPSRTQQVPPSQDPYAQRPQSTYDNPQELGSANYHSPVDTRRQSYPPPVQFQHIQQGPSDDYSPSIYSPNDDHPPQQTYPQQQQQQPQQQQSQPPYPTQTPQQQSYPPQPSAYPPQPPSQAPQPPPSGVPSQPPPLNHQVSSYSIPYHSGPPQGQAPQPPQQQQSNYPPSAPSPTPSNPYPVLNVGPSQGQGGGGGGGGGGQPQYQAYQPPKQQQPQQGFVQGDASSFYR